LPKVPINTQTLSTVFLYGLLCILAAYSVAGASASESSYWQDKFYIERSFRDIALNAEYTEEGVPPVIKRWTQPLRVWMHSGEGDARTPFSSPHLRAHETPEHLVCRLLLET